MSTHRVPILGFGTKPDNSGEVFPESFEIKATNKKWKRNIFVFKDGASKISLFGGFQVPQNFISNAGVVLERTSSATAGSGVYELEYRAVGGNDVESLDQSSAQETVSGIAPAPTVAVRKNELSMALTDANLAIGDEVEFILSRDNPNVVDNMAADDMLFGAYFEYNDI